MNGSEIVTAANRATACEKIAIALLAGGLSQRYAKGDKLLAPWRSKPLIQHAMEALAAQPVEAAQFGIRWAVVAPGKPQLAQLLERGGYTILTTEAPPHGMGYSIATAARAALNTQAEALLVCLGDMPLVSAATLGKLVHVLASRPQATIAVSGNQRRTPPVLFRRCHFAELALLADDNGGKALFQRHAKSLVAIDLPAAEQLDFDREADFLQA